MRFILLAPVLCALALAGCAASKGPTDRELARKHWALARANVLASLAKDQYTGGNFDDCRKTLNEAIKLDPENAGLRVLMARLNIEQGNLEMADRELVAARKLDPKNAEADYLAGVVSQRWQKLQVAYDFYRTAGEKNPSELAYVLAQAEMLVALGRSDEAMDLLQSRVVFFENSAAIRDAVGSLLMQKGKYAQAADLFRQASVLATEDVSIREHLAIAQLRSKQYREASETLRRVLQDTGYVSRADLHVAMGECRLQINQAREAREAFDIATQISPSDPTGWLGLGKAALELNDLRRAELALKRCLAIDGANAHANLLLGYVRLKQSRPEEALASFKKAAALDESDTVSLCMVGYVLEKLGRTDEALACYAKALKQRPGDELASRLMADIQLKP